MINSYRDLEVWQKAMDLTVACYKLSTTFPKSEQYGLSSQLQRAAASVPANIARPVKYVADSCLSWSYACISPRAILYFTGVK